MLAKRAIEKAIRKKELEITPFRKCQLNPNSYDVRLGEQIAYYSLAEMDEMKLVYGQVDTFHTPRDFGHQAAMDYEDPAVTHVVQQTIFDLVHENATMQDVIPDTGFTLYPGVLYLAFIEEEIYSNFYVPEIGGKSSLARAGITIHETSGYANLGDRCRFVIEITVKYPTVIYPHMRIGQVVFHESSESGAWNRFLVKHGFRKPVGYTGRYAGKQSLSNKNNIIPRYVPSKELQMFVELAKKEQEEESIDSGDVVLEAPIQGTGETSVVENMDSVTAVDEGMAIDLDQVELVEDNGNHVSMEQETVSEETKVKPEE